MIHDYKELLVSNNKYNVLAEKIKEFKLSEQINEGFSSYLAFAAAGNFEQEQQILIGKWQILSNCTEIDTNAAKKQFKKYNQI